MGLDRNPELGLQALYAGNLIEAEAYFTGALEENPLSPQAFFYRGKVNHQLGRAAQAIADFQKALELHPLYNQARMALEMLRLKLIPRA